MPAACENLRLSFRIVCPLTELTSLALGMADGRGYREARSVYGDLPLELRRL